MRRVGNVRHRWPECDVGKLILFLCRCARHNAAADVGTIVVNMKIKAVVQRLIVEMDIGDAAVDVPHVGAAERIAKKFWALALL